MAVFEVWITITIALISFVITFLCKTWHNFPIPEDGLQFYLENRFSGDRKLLLTENFHNFQVNNEEALYVIIHGYTESSARTWVADMSEALLSAEPNSSVLVLDYWNYLSIRRLHMTENIQRTAKEFSQFLETFCKAKQISFDRVHVLAFSLGGRIAGSLSNYLKPENQIGRITGIDASFPWKGSSDPREYLDSSDAKLVVALRTSRVALTTPPVHIDFFFNGRSEVQPQCCKWWHFEFVCQLCSHYRSLKLFIEALKSDHKSSSCRCDENLSPKESCTLLERNSFGLHTNPQLQGAFCPVTNSAPPFLMST